MFTGARSPASTAGAAASLTPCPCATGPPRPRPPTPVRPRWRRRASSSPAAPICGPPRRKPPSRPTTAGEHAGRHPREGRDRRRVLPEPARPRAGHLGAPPVGGGARRRCRRARPRPAPAGAAAGFTDRRWSSQRRARPRAGASHPDPRRDPRHLRALCLTSEGTLVRALGSVGGASAFDRVEAAGPEVPVRGDSRTQCRAGRRRRPPGRHGHAAGGIGPRRRRALHRAQRQGRCGRGGGRARRRRAGAREQPRDRRARAGRGSTARPGSSTSAPTSRRRSARAARRVPRRW